MFAATATQDGRVVEVNDKGIIVEYADNTRKGVTLGRIFGKAEGSVYPHDVVSDLKVDQKFAKGDPIAYNTGFFERDILDSTKIVMKNSMLVKTALYESNQTHEDSSAISQALAKRLNARTTKVKSFLINFSQNLLNAVKVGQEVSPKDFLMIIEDEITATNEVFYHGDKQDMSATLKSITDKSDRLMADSCKASGKPVITGEVNDDYRVGGVPLTLDKAEVRFYITIDTVVGTGDKIIFGSQLKSVVGETMDYSITTESGMVVDAIFSNRSLSARIVNSPYILGTTATLLSVIGKKAIAIYRK